MISIHTLVSCYALLFALVICSRVFLSYLEDVGDLFSPIPSLFSGSSIEALSSLEFEHFLSLLSLLTWTHRILYITHT
ncbi:hypothetical protein K435DRAFT_440040 [Dendrothele bispora CBS 962.96]|uniref:Uncharacterized protein n=1 Tax=Dendrothele bispora (strain CBS 962.96) TaxID=1314807 RepID=A0A4S8L324_DENBC|nr:hypothetical protein K435DRAFT_440040 [Dendrothele bispora CBS 962.96]